MSNVLVQAGDPVLRSPARTVDPSRLDSKEMRELVELMTKVMRAAPGVGLAAPQIGVPLRVIVLEDNERLMSKLDAAGRAARERSAFPLTVIVNPEIVARGSDRATFFEGCLSVAGYMALVERDLEVEVKGLDREGEPLVWRVRGWPARILQHEIDHLNGTLYVDRMITRTFSANTEVGRWLALAPDDVKKELGVD